MGRNGGRKMMRRDGSSRKGSWVLPPITILDEEGGQGGEGPEGQGQNGGGEGSEAGEMLVEEAEGPEEGEEDQISPLTLVLIVFLYLLLGAALIDWLDPHVDFPNGIYFAFLCLTAIEYGKLIPTDALYLPLVIAYICFGLAISTIALDIGSTYVKKLYYLGRKIRNIASIKIWFGAKHLRVRELLAALGHNIGLEPTVLCDLDLEQLISSAIQVKEGRLHRVPQTHMIMDGIWPPELVPLFLKDGGRFPDWVDAEERRKWSVVSLFRRRPSHQVPPKHSGSTRSAGAVSVLLNQPPERTPPLPPLQPDRLSVRFEEFVRTDEDDRWLPLAQRRLLPPPPPTLPEETEPDSTTSGIISDPDLSAIDAALPSSWSLSADPDLHHHHHPQESIAAQLQMRRSETVPPSGHPDSSLFQMCNFPSMEMSTRRPPLPPLRPLPEEEEEREEGSG